jgi:hypothetical protein
MTHIYNDTYLSGDPSLERVVVPANETDARTGETKPQTAGLAYWKLPGSEHRIVSTLTDFNKNFPFLHQNEARWRNAMNEKKRMRMGLATEADKEQIAEEDAYEKKWKEEFHMKAMKA